MSSDIETRILEMKLDNDQFEKGVKSTIQSLEELEEKLELKDAADGFDKVSKAANTMQFSSMERSLDAITDKFSLLGNVGLQALERISNKIVDIGENIIKGITVDPVMDGWREFEMKTNSIQTIFGGIRNKYPDTPFGKSQAFADIGRELDKLNQYADQTIYNFAQMTENVGKFTNQRIDLETATKAIQGVGNWAAMVGADTAQMSRAMYNISQGLGGGSMKLIDWKSIKYANMATPDVQQMFADIAYAQGGMLDKNGKAYKKGSKQAKQAYQAIIKDFEGSLKSGWLTNQVMMNGLKILSGELKGEELVKLFGDTEEAAALAAYYEKMGADAAEAATQIKTLTQLIGVLQESLGSGWATSFEKLFGGFQRQTEFFTKIADIIGGYIERDAEARNSWIDKFTQNNAGTEKLLGFFENLISLLTEVWGLSQVVTDALISPFNGAYWFGDEASRALFGGLENNLNDTGLTAQHVAGVIGNLNIILERLHDWFHGDRVLDDGTFEEATPAFENVSKIFAGLGSVVMIALNALEHFGQFVVHVAALFEPLASSILNMFGNVGEVLYSLYQNLAGQQTFRDFFMKLYAVVAPIVNAISEFLSSVIDLIASLFDLGTSLDETGAMAENNKLGPFIKTISDIFKTLPIFMAPVTGFLTRIVTKITDFVRGVTKGFPAIKKHVKREGVTPFEDLKDIVQEFIAAGFGEETAKAITDWYNNNVKGTFAAVVDWFSRGYTSITTFFQELPGKITTLVERVKAAFNAFKNYNYNDAVSPYQNFKDRMQGVIMALFGEETGNQIIKSYKEHVEPYILQVAGAIEAAFGEVKRVLNGLVRVFVSDYTGMENPFDLLQAIALNFLSGYDEGNISKETIQRRFAVMDFFKNLEETYNTDFKPTVDKVTGWVTKDIPAAFNTIQEYLFGKDLLVNKGEGGLAHLEMEHVPGLFEDMLTWINGEGRAKLGEITQFFDDTWNSVIRGLFGYDVSTEDGKVSHVKGLIDNVFDFLLGEVDEKTKQRTGGAIQAIADWYTKNEATFNDIFTNKIPALFDKIADALFGHKIIGKQGNTWREGGIFQDIQNSFASISAWANGKGAEMWEEISTLILGHKIVGKQGNTWREGGALKAIQSIIDPIWDWIQEKGGKAIDYITNHNFSEIWAKLSELFAGQEVLDAAGKPHFEGGYFSELINVLRPISDFIGRVGNSLYEKVNSIDFIELWRKIGELLYGYDEYGLVNEGSGDTYYETKHVDGLFDKIGAFFDRVTAFFESDTWKGIKETIERVYTQYIKPTFDFLGGGLGTLFQYNFDKGFFENFGSNFENLSGYLTTEFPKLLEKWFPEGFDLSSVVGNLVPDWLSNLIPEDWKKSLENFLNGGSADGGAKGGSASSKPPTGESAQSALMRRFGLTGKELIGSNLFSDVVGLYGSYNERLAEGKAEVESAQKESTDKTESFETDVTKTVDQFAENRETVRDTLHSILKTIGDFLGTLFGGAGQIGTMIFGTIALSNVSDTVQALTGHQKDSFIQDIADLFEAIGGFLGNMALLIGVGAASSYVDHIIEADETAKEQTEQLEDGESKTEKLEERVNTIDHIFNRVFELIRNITLLIGGIAGASWGLEMLGDWGIDVKRDEKGLNYGSDTTSIAENMQAIGDAIMSVASTVGVFMESLFKMVAFEALIGLLDNSFFTKGEKTLSTTERMDVLIKRAVEIMGKLGEALGQIMTKSLLPLIANNAVNAGLGVGVNLLTSTKDITGKRTGGMKSRFDTYSSTLLAVGSLMESFAGALGTVLTTLSLSELFTDYEALDSKLKILERIGTIFKDLLGAVSGIVIALSAKDVTNSIQGLNIDLPWLKGKFNGAENTHAAGGLGIGTYAKLFGFTTLLGVLVLALSETALVIMEKHLASASSTVMVAASQIQSVIEAVGRLTPEQTGNAVGALEAVTKMFTEMGKWTEASEYTVKQSMHFRDVLINASMGFEAMSKGLTGFDQQTMIGAFESIGKIMEYIKGEQGFDPAEFQGKMSFMQLAGQNFQSTVEAFRYITIGDIGQLAIVKIYFEAFQEIAEILSAIGSLGNFGAGFMAFDSGFNAYSFIEFLAQVRTLSGRDDLKYAFEQIIEALPDSPELLQKLKNFSNSGGGSLGLFTSGIMGLTGALRGYQEVMEKIGTQNFTDQANALDKIDKLGASLGEKDFNAIGELNANTRLGLFANDVKTLAAGLKELAIVKTDGSEYNFESLVTFFERLNRIGVIIDGYSNTVDIGDGFSVFVTQFQSLQSGFSTFVDTISSEKFDKQKLDVATGFLKDLAMIGGAIPQEMIHLLNRKTFLPDDRNEVTQINSEKLAEFLTSIGTALPTLGNGISSFNQSIHGSGIILKDNQTAEELKIAADFIEQIARAASYMNEGIKLVDFSSAGAFIYTFNELADDLWREDGTGLFNVMAKIFDFANSEEFDATGMRLANEAFSSFGGFAQGLSALLNTGSNISEGQAGGLGSAVEKLFKEGIYGSIQSMPITELQSYAAAFSDLSNALAMNGQTATLVTAIDQAIEALKDKEIQITVTPVWKDGSLAGDLNAPSMTVTPNVTNTYSAATIQNITFPDVQAVKLVPEDMSALTNATRDAATTVAGRVDTMSNTIGGLRVQLDTGVLVGYLVPAINRRMGRDYSNPRYIPVFDYTSEP